MNSADSLGILDRLLEPLAGSLPNSAAESIVNLRADLEMQVRIDELADKASEGQLTPDEEAEYSAIVEAIDLIGVLQAKARKALSRSTAA
ncbi:MAG: hypothetical protein H7A53_10660 [Akkermansiaceae bacterium]|nr:hypothetical protein [Akkermansiaceae bacterium]MCP5551338.1 hypothetical protein [Akkermansiaceae bacterium]